jgi:phosphoadenosine phosphosulfate reductase
MTLATQIDYKLQTRVDMAIARLREFAPPDGEPYYLAYSGGKDSTVLLELAKRSGVPFEIHYNQTSVDPPELVRFIRRQPGVIIDKPGETMWQLILREKFPPVRSIRGLRSRWCCEALKERGGEGRTVLTGIRWAESLRRQQTRLLFENRQQSQGRVLVNPIIDWQKWDVWGFIRGEGLPYCSLYDEGFERLGCIMCPQQGTWGMKRDAARWPKYAAAYIRTFDRVIALRRAKGKRCTWNTGQELYDWWVSGEGGTPEEPDVDEQGCFLYEVPE